MGPQRAGGRGSRVPQQRYLKRLRYADHFEVHISRVFFFNFFVRSGRFGARVLRQDRSSDCHFVRALSREPLSLTALHGDVCELSRVVVVVLVVIVTLPNRQHRKATREREKLVKG